MHSWLCIIRATAAVCSSFVMHVPQMLLSVCVSCVLQRYRTLESGVGVFYHGMLRTLDTLLIFMLFFRLLTRNTGFLFVCHIS